MCRYSPQKRRSLRGIRPSEAPAPTNWINQLEGADAHYRIQALINPAEAPVDLMEQRDGA